MDCPEVRELLPDLERDELPARCADAVRAHLAGCAACRRQLEEDAALRAVLKAHGRRPATPALRARVAQAVQEHAAGHPWRPRWRRPAWLVPALALAAAVFLVWTWMGQTRPDPVALLTAQAVREHVEYSREAMPRPAPEPQALLAAVSTGVGFPVQPVFRGDPEAQLITAAASELQGRRAAALTYRSAAGVYSTLFLLPDGPPVPAEHRMTIQSYRPYHHVASGHQLLLWTQRGLTHVLVSDLGERDLPALFLKIRTAA